ncbi:hypothetical protein [Actinomadura sp. SCN-SB]|uniref:hypothetical protein n=1 Tax=Actinomadura sp. SCN-SB TaxID=3373092 RepID=UPI0037506510
MQLNGTSVLAERLTMDRLLCGLSEVEAVALLASFSTIDKGFADLNQAAAATSAGALRDELASLLGVHGREGVHLAVRGELPIMESSPHPDDRAWVAWCRYLVASRVSEVTR